ncbi:hypothetical protein EJ02DRAFT_182295 [Clathrospora elynae]|uniref:Uncharacterized protein n=1 Tax=Clathrospora elynae TaxID=706981 RepID=A0A6A5SQP1_9PLEO|nr:hypothetical protein EJ02DRAFT_182295 [Clathrospora elynae]
MTRALVTSIKDQLATSLANLQSSRHLYYLYLSSIKGRKLPCTFQSLTNKPTTLLMLRLGKPPKPFCPQHPGLVLLLHFGHVLPPPTPTPKHTCKASMTLPCRIRVVSGRVWMWRASRKGSSWLAESQWASSSGELKKTKECLVAFLGDLLWPKETTCCGSFGNPWQAIRRVW